MGLLKELKKTGKQLLSCLVSTPEERAARPKRLIYGKDTGIIVQQPEGFVREIFDALGNHFAWERADGGWDSSTPLTLVEVEAEKADAKGDKHKTIERRIGNDTDHSFESMKALAFPYAPSS